VLLDDLSAEELGNAIAGSLTGCLINSGQTCSATTRLLVPRDRLAEVEGLLEVFVQFAPMGDPMDPATQQGPLVSKRQQESVRAYIQGAVDDGAKLSPAGRSSPSTCRRASS
jgi:acyl-CoA reductase-like NAD-dependent aldehyde dehydrogenase